MSLKLLGCTMILLETFPLFGVVTEAIVFD